MSWASLKTLRAHIEQLIAKWRPILGLEHWYIEVHFNEPKSQATCRAQPEYEEALIRFNLPCIRREVRNAARLEDLVVHELCHCLTWRIHKGPVDEQMTTRVHRALLRAAKAA